MNFSKVATITPRDVVGLADFTDPCDSDTFTHYTEGTLGAVTCDGQLTIANTTSSARNNIVCQGADMAIPQMATEVSVVSRSGSPTGYDNIGVGIAKDASNFVFAGYDRINGKARIQVKIGGANTFNAEVSRTWAAPYKLGFSLVGNSACMYVDTGSGWLYVTGYDLSSKINFRTAALTGWKAAMTVATPNNSTWVFDDFKGGRFGAFGLRDPSIVTEENGTPHIVDGEVYVAMTAADPMGSCYQGVFALDLATYALRQTAAIMVLRSSVKQLDVAMHISIAADGSRRLVSSTWGNGFGQQINIEHGTTADDVLNGTFLVGPLTKLNLPRQLTGFCAYDGFLIKDGSTWRLAHTICENLSFSGNPFYPAVATSTDLLNWTDDGDDQSTQRYEGTKFIKDPAGDYLISAGTFNAARLYDKRMNFRGFVNATSRGGSSTQPHAMIFWTGDKWVLLGFDDQKPAGAGAAFSWGRLIVHEAAA